MKNIFKVTGFLALAIGLQVVNVEVCLTPDKSPNFLEALEFHPPDGGGPTVSVGSGTR
jgi:hypothetical protein